MHPQPGSYHIAKVSGGNAPINRATGTLVYPIPFGSQATTTILPPDFYHDPTELEGGYDNVYSLMVDGHYSYRHSDGWVEMRDHTMRDYRVTHPNVEIGYFAVFDADRQPGEQMYDILIDDLCPGSELSFSL